MRETDEGRGHAPHTGRSSTWLWKLTGWLKSSAPQLNMWDKSFTRQQRAPSNGDSLDRIIATWWQHEWRPPSDPMVNGAMREGHEGTKVGDQKNRQQPEIAQCRPLTKLPIYDITCLWHTSWNGWSFVCCGCNNTWPSGQCCDSKLGRSQAHGQWSDTYLWFHFTKCCTSHHVQSHIPSYLFALVINTM
jgi:hypothetical protein